MKLFFGKKRQKEREKQAKMMRIGEHEKQLKSIDEVIKVIDEVKNQHEKDIESKRHLKSVKVKFGINGVDVGILKIKHNEIVVKLAGHKDEEKLSMIESLLILDNAKRQEWTNIFVKGNALGEDGE